MKHPAPQGAEIVPFGKYKGQPLELLLADQDYLHWVSGQPGLMAMLQSRHPAVFNIITVGAPVNSDTPEHNALQARFLAQDFQYAFIELAMGKSVHATATTLAENENAEAEKRFNDRLAAAKENLFDAEKWFQKGATLPDYFTEAAQNARKAYEVLAAKPRPAPVTPQRPTIEVEFECGYDVELHAWGWRSDGGNYYGGWRFRIELKPQMGDDFPAVLRQMKRNEADTLVVGSFEATTCTLEQVRKMFGQKRIITLQEIEAVRQGGVWPEG
jgi:hypothetical protein